MAVALGGTIAQLLQAENKNFPPNTNSSQGKPHMQTACFCSAHVYEYEETDEERAKRRKMAVMEQDIRCFE